MNIRVEFYALLNNIYNNYIFYFNDVLWYYNHNLKLFKYLILNVDFNGKSNQVEFCITKYGSTTPVDVISLNML